MKWQRTYMLVMVAILLAACGTVGPKRESKVPYEILLHNHDKSSWNPDTAKTAAFLFLNDAHDITKYPIAGTSDPVSSPFPPAEFGTIDFSREVALFLTRGLGHSAPYGFEVTDVTQDTGVLIVKLKFISPADKGVGVDNFRVSLVKIPRAALPSRPFQVRFVDQTGKVVRELEVQ